MKRTGALNPGKWSNSENKSPIKRWRRRKTDDKPLGPMALQRHKKNLAMKRAKIKGPSLQTLKRKEGQRVWSIWVRKVQVVYLYLTEGIDYGRCEKCGWMVGLEGDHVVPKSNFRIILHDPLNGQVLDHGCNDEKGSVHTKGTDYRSAGMRKFYAKVAAHHWGQHGDKGIWNMNGAGHKWIGRKAPKLSIPGLELDTLRVPR